MSCANCKTAFDCKPIAKLYCTRRCYRAAWTRAKRQADPAAWRDEMRSRRSDPAFATKQREANRRSNEKRRAEIADRQRAWAVANSEKVRAEKSARRAVKAGRLAKEPCLFCDEQSVHGHHHDHSKPLDVTWLCVRHHGLAHREVDAHVVH